MSSWLRALIDATSINNSNSQDATSPMQALALVVSGRERQLHHAATPIRAAFDDIDTLENDPHDEWLLPLGAYMSMIDGYIEQGLEKLNQVRTNVTFDGQLRVVAAILSAIAYADLGKERDGIAACVDSLESLKGTVTPVAEALLQLQAYLRAFEIGDYSTAEEFLNQAAIVLESAIINKTSDDEDLVEIARYSIEANRLDVERVLRDTISFARSNSSPYWSTLEKRLLTGLTLFLNDTYETNVRDRAAVRRRVIIGKNDPVTNLLYPYSIACQIVGHSQKSRQSYAILGQEHLLRDSTSPEWARSEGLKLLRRAGELQPLEAGLLKVRAQGPLEALIQEFNRATEHARLSLARPDLVVLRIGAPCMDPAASSAAIQHLLRHATGTASRDHFGAFRIDDYLWRTIGALLSVDVELHEEVSKAVLDRLSTAERAAYWDMRAVVNSLDWTQVSTDTMEGWLSWARQPLDSDANNVAIDMLTDAGKSGFTQAEDGIRNKWNQSHNEILAASMVELARADRRGLLDEFASEVADFCLDRLETIQSSSAAGSHGFGGIEIARVTAAFNTLASRHSIWPNLISFLSDGNVMMNQKETTLDWLAHNYSSVPVEQTQALADELRLPSDSAAADDIFGRSNSSSILRYLCRAGRAETSAAVAAYLQLSNSSEHIDRIDAARSGEFVCNAVSPDFVIGVTMKLLEDDSAPVRSAAARQLAILSPQLETQVRAVAVQRMETILHSDGLVEALSVLRGIESLKNEYGRVIISDLRDIISQLSTTATTYIIRKICSSLISSQST